MDITVFVSPNVEGSCPGGNVVQSNITIWCTRRFVSFPDEVAFEHTSTETFNGDAIDIGWMEFMHCAEGNGAPSAHQYDNGFSLSQMIDLAQHAVTLKILPSTDTPGSSETTAYAVTADLCSNPVFALNNGYEMSYALDLSNAQITSYGDINDWIGDSVALDRLNHTGMNGKIAGNLPSALSSDMVFAAYSNAAGLDVTGTRCEWEFGAVTGNDMTVWIGFHLDKTKWCEIRDDGSYGLSSPTSCDDIYGDWTLVRHAYSQWHNANDSLAGDQADDGTWWIRDPQLTSTWRMQFQQALYAWPSIESAVLMFSNGDCSEYLITTYGDATYEPGSADLFQGHIHSSHFGDDYYATWQNWAGIPASPWISWNNHTTDNYRTILYGEDGDPGGRFQVPGADLSVNVWLQTNDYFAIGRFATWSEAQSACQAEGTTLASIHSLGQARQARLVCLDAVDQQTIMGCWIGLNDINSEGVWEWSDGSATDYGFTNSNASDPTTGSYPWTGGQPSADGNCVHLWFNANEYAWNDLTCNPNADAYFEHNFALCNKKTEPIKDTCLSDIDAWFDADSLDLETNVWNDKSGNNYKGYVVNSNGIGVFDGLNSSHELYTATGVKAVYGSTATQIVFHPRLDPSTHTVFSVCKYREVGAKLRILQTETEDAYFGFSGGQSGVAHAVGTSITDDTDRYGNDWVVSTQQQDLYRGNSIDYTADGSKATMTQTNRLWINGGYTNEPSDWACSEIIIINRKLSLTEYNCVERKLFDKYGFVRRYPVYIESDASFSMELYDDDRIVSADGNTTLY
eukprot:806788_1